MDARAEAFANQLRATFKVEAAEHLKSISDGLLALEENPSADKRKEIVETIFRDAHSLKGSARAVSLEAIQNICQSLENVLSQLRKGDLELSREHFDTLYATVDLVTKMVDEPQLTGKAPSKILQDLIDRLNRIEAGEKKIPETPAKAPIEESAPQSQPAPAPAAAAATTIRVALPKLDKVMQQVEEMLTFKMIASQRHARIRDLRHYVRKWKDHWHQVQSNLRKMRECFESELGSYTPSKEFLHFLEEQPSQIAEMESKISQLEKNAGQDTRFTTVMVDNLLEDTKKILMLPFSSVFDILPRMVRDLAHSLNKEVALTISGGDVEVDRRILEEMKDPLIHLIRNCLDHAIEPAEVREKAGKDPQGRLIISAIQMSGNTVEISVTDDGKGIDADAVKKKAVACGFLDESEAKKMPEEDALKLIFKSGVSTSPIVTELSGRGVGMGVVLEKVEKLGGSVRLQTRLGFGTTVSITLPLTIATFRGVHIRVADQDYIFPTHYLQRVMRIPPESIHTAEGKSTVAVKGRNLSYVYLSDLLGINAPSTGSGKYLYLLIIKVAETIFSVGVDAVFNEQEVFIKGLGKQLASVRNISAVTIMEEGKVIPILNPFDLKTSIRHAASSAARDVVQEGESEKKVILVVEDSSTARLLLKNIFESAGYEVVTATDGAEGFATLKTTKVDLLLSDVEMPRMDGFALTQKVRASDTFKDLPIVLCTSLGSQEDREHGIEVGANAYITKSSFVQSHLLDIVNKFLE